MYVTNPTKMTEAIKQIQPKEKIRHAEAGIFSIPSLIANLVLPNQRRS